MASTLTVLLIEDDRAMQTALARSLSRSGMQLHVCGDGLLALDEWQRCHPDVVLLDLSLPGLDGLEVLARARERGWITPVIVLTARGTVGDKVLGLNAGADDYLPKPFDLDELEARIRALVRRKLSSIEKILPTPHQYYGLSYEHNSNAIYFQGQPLDLSSREASFLYLMIERRGQAVAKEKLLEQVFAGDADVQPEAIEVVAYRLRKKISHLPLQLVTLRGLGYVLKPAQTPTA
jgi:two-component system, OmpR family, response regulator TctD